MKPQHAAAEESDADTEAFARDIAEWTWDLKALNTRVIDLRGRVSYTDFVVVTTGTSYRHVQAIAKHVSNRAGEVYDKDAFGREGIEHGQWALVDFGDVILHVFNGPLREEYDLERMWTEAPRLELEEQPKNLYGHFELDEFE